MKPAWLCPLAHAFQHPHHLAGTVLARILTNAATMLWAGLVLMHDGSLTNSRYGHITEFAPENAYAIFFGTLASAQMLCLWTHRAPRWYTNLGYAVLSLAWTYVFVFNLLQPTPFPTATSLSFVVAFTAMYAFLDGHTRGGNDVAS